MGIIRLHDLGKNCIELAEDGRVDRGTDVLLVMENSTLSVVVDTQMITFWTGFVAELISEAILGRGGLGAL